MNSEYSPKTKKIKSIEKARIVEKLRLDLIDNMSNLAAGAMAGDPDDAHTITKMIIKKQEKKELEFFAYAEDWVSTTLATTKLQMSISPKTSPLSMTTTTSCLTRCSTSPSRKEAESPRSRKLHSTSPLLYRKPNPHTLILGVGIGYTANRSVHRNCPTNSKFFELLRTIATNILSNDISFCCHWHLHVLFILLRIGSNMHLMVL